MSGETVCGGVRWLIKLNFYRSFICRFGVLASPWLHHFGRNTAAREENVTGRLVLCSDLSQALESALGLIPQTLGQGEVRLRGASVWYSFLLPAVGLLVVGYCRLHCSANIYYNCWRICISQQWKETWGICPAFLLDQTWSVQITEINNFYWALGGRIVPSLKAQCFHWVLVPLLSLRNSNWRSAWELGLLLFYHFKNN